MPKGPRAGAQSAHMVDPALLERVVSLPACWFVPKGILIVSFVLQISVLWALVMSWLLCKSLTLKSTCLCSGKITTQEQENRPNPFILYRCSSTNMWQCPCTGYAGNCGHFMSSKPKQTYDIYII